MNDKVDVAKIRAEMEAWSGCGCCADEFAHAAYKAMPELLRAYEDRQRLVDECAQWLDTAAKNWQVCMAIWPDAKRWRWTSKRAWFVDAAAHAFDLRFGPGDFSTEPRNADEDDVIEAIDKAMKEEDPDER